MIAYLHSVDSKTGEVILRIEKKKKDTYWKSTKPVWIGLTKEEMFNLFVNHKIRIPSQVLKFFYKKIENPNLSVKPA